MTEYAQPVLPGSDDDRVGRRRSPRRYLEAQVQFGQNSHRTRVRMIDLSCHGARLSLNHPLKESDSFWITLPGLAPMSARVTWVDGFIIGCEFTDPLPPATFASLMPGKKVAPPIDRRHPRAQL